MIGDSGVGKSTLLHVLGGLDRPDAGRLTLDGADLFGGSPALLRRYRNRDVGFVFQFHHLLPELSALENVELPFRIARRGGGEGRKRARGLLERLGLEDRLGHAPSKLSGGEQQRVAIARAVAAGPRLVLADEPTGNLDPQTGQAVFDLLGELQAEEGFALIVASHSGRLARSCRRVTRLVDGKLVEMTPQDVGQFFGGLGAPDADEPML